MAQVVPNRGQLNKLFSLTGLPSCGLCILMMLLLFYHWCKIHLGRQNLQVWTNYSLLLKRYKIDIQFLRKLHVLCSVKALLTTLSDSNDLISPLFCVGSFA